MKGLWLQDGRLEYREDLPEPRPKAGEALLRVLRAGVCGTDLELVRGYYGFRGIPGHEFVGEVLQAEDPAWVGRRVAAEINVVCRSCPECLAGRRNHCRNRTVLGIKNRHGAFAERVALPLDNLAAVPENVSDDQAVFAEPLAAALRIQQQVSLSPSDRVLVVGAGRLGQLVARTLALTGCRLRAVVRHESQVRALGRLSDCAIGEAEVESGWADVAVEATGSPGGFELARRSVRPGGVIVLKSTFHGAVPLDLSALAVDELTLVGSRCGPFEPALRLLEQGLLETQRLIEGTLPLREGLRAFERAARPGALKVLLQP